MKELNDQALISAYVGGDGSAINILIERYNKKVFNYILMLTKNSATAEDLTQDLFIKIMSSLKSGRYSDNGRFQSWLMRIAHNMVIDFFRHEKQKHEVSTDGEYDILNNRDLVDNNVEDKMITTQIESDVKKLVDKLPLEQREVVIMRHYLGMSFKEIAEQTDVSINTALGRMRYALLNLRKLIEDHQMSLV